MDLHNQIDFRRAISPQAVSDNTAVVSQILDCANFRQNGLAIATGSLVDADATFAVLLQHGDQANLSDAADVPDSDLLGTEAAASFTFANDDVTRKIGYAGNKRYIRATITPSANASAANIAAVWYQSGARVAPRP